jgi:hypothetical protein
MSRSSAPGRGSSSKRSREKAMERTHPATKNRHDEILRLRQQVADGAYETPVDELVNRLVSVVMARQAAAPPGAPR